jgi:hypothetical protein
MSAWLSFFGGYAQGANEQIDEQRKREDQYIQDRMKMAAATRLEKQKEAEKQRKDLQEADLSLSINEDYKNAPTAVKIAMLSSPELREIYSTRKKVDPATTVMDIVATSPPTEEIAKKYNTVDQWRSSFQAKPKAVDAQTQEAFNAPRQAFGARVGSGRDQLAQNAARFGMKPDEALGWESGGEELPSMNVGATLKQGALAPTDIDGQLKLVEAEALKAQQSGDAEAMSKVTAKAAGLQSLKKMLEGGEEAVNYQRKLDMVQWQIITAKTPEEKRRLESLKVEMERVKDLGTRKPEGADGAGKPPTYAMLKGAADSAGTRAVMARFGNEVKNGGVAISTDVNGNQTISFGKLDLEKQAEIRQVYDTAASEVFKPYVRNGVPINDATRLAMQATGQSIQAAPQPTKPDPSGTTEPTQISMKEIVAIAAEQKKPVADIVNMYMTAKDAKGKPRYKVVS